MASTHPLPPTPGVPRQPEYFQSQPSHYQQPAQYGQPQQPYIQQQLGQYPQQQPSSPPQTQQAQPQSSPVKHRQTKSRTFSFQSHKSANSKGSDLQETHDEKEQKRIHSKADPTLAMQEAEPAYVASHSEQTITPLRSMRHLDGQGNPIEDPDKSNPTRNRWERPLETIRSFEAAIDGGYDRRSTIVRSGSENVQNWNRRSVNIFPSNQQPRFPHDSYYGGSSRPMSYRSDHYHNNHQGNHDDGHYKERKRGPGPDWNRVPRPGHPTHGQASYSHPGEHHERAYSHHPPYGTESGVYPLPNKDRSYETVTSAAASGGSEQAGYNTDPTSSENSSINRQSPAKRPEPPNDYGIGFSHSNSAQAANFSIGLPSNTVSSPPMDNSMSPTNQFNGQSGGFQQGARVLQRKLPPSMQPMQSGQPQAAQTKRRSRLSFLGLGRSK